MIELLRVLVQTGRLKTLRRAGWLRIGLTDGESVADHSFGTALLALLLATDLDVDRDRVIKLALVHDLAESDPEVGDITPYCGIDPP
jgi:putative hydrolase of HD superfamily